MVKIVHNKILGGWYVVRGPHHAPINDRFDSREEAKAWLKDQQAKRDNRVTYKRAA